MLAKEFYNGQSQLKMTFIMLNSFLFRVHFPPSSISTVIIDIEITLIVMQISEWEIQGVVAFLC